jgi:hypothetical protein
LGEKWNTTQWVKWRGFSYEQDQALSAFAGNPLLIHLE